MNALSKNIVIGATGLASLVAPMQTNAQTLEVADQKPLINSPYISSTIKSEYGGSRGFTSSTGGAWQNDFGFNIGKVTFDCWSNFDVQKNKLNEIDYGLSYGFNFKGNNISISATDFTSPTSDFKNCVEIGVNVSRNLTSGKYPLSVNAYAGELFGVKEYEGQFFSLGLNQSVPIVKNVKLDLSTMVAYDNHYFGVQGSGFSHAQVGAGLDVKLMKDIHVKPFVSVQKAVESLGGTFKDNLVYGLTVSKSW
ncbi:MAG: hypothetical protein WCK29_01530 [archaeon]